jgi:hypothetical protein
LRRIRKELAAGMSRRLEGIGAFTLACAGVLLLVALIVSLLF